MPKQRTPVQLHAWAFEACSLTFDTGTDSNAMLIFNNIRCRVLGQYRFYYLLHLTLVCLKMIHIAPIGQRKRRL